MFDWWHWMVLGLCLAMSELVVPAFFLIWFGIGALLVGLVVLFAPPIGIALQLLLWTLFSASLVFFWFRYLKPKTMSEVGSSSAQVTGEVGLLLNELGPNTRGHVRFQKPVLGADVWDCYADTPIKAGVRVRIVRIEGSFVNVEEVK